MYNFFYYLITFFVMAILVKYTIVYFPKDFVLGCILIAYFLELLINIIYHHKLLGK